MQSRRVSRRRSADASAERLILAHLPLVRPIAKKVLAGLPAHVELNDPSGAAHAGAAPSSAEPCDLRADESWQPDVQARREELRAVLLAAMKSLPARYRRIMLLYHWRGLTMGEIGTAFGINESRVSQIHKRALELMAGCLTSIGITSSGSLRP